MYKDNLIEYNQCNGVISDKINEFKVTSCKSNPGLELMEEKLKLDIYKKINEIFYK